MHNAPWHGTCCILCCRQGSSHAHTDETCHKTCSLSQRCLWLEVHFDLCPWVVVVAVGVEVFLDDFVTIAEVAFEAEVVLEDEVVSLLQEDQCLFF